MGCANIVHYSVSKSREGKAKGNVCREKFIFQGETLNCENWKWKENNHFKSDSTALNPLLLKLYSVYIAASN